MNILEDSRDKAVGRVGGGCVRVLEEAGLIVLPADMMNIRPVKLITKGAFFVSVRDDEPYFRAVYSMIRQHERDKGTWTEGDEEVYQRHMSDEYAGRPCYAARCPTCHAIVGAMVDAGNRPTDDIARFVSLMIRDGMIIERMPSEVARSQFGECTCEMRTD